jgi:hypothetical protein
MRDRVERVRQFIREVRAHGWASVKRLALNFVGLSVLGAALWAADADPLLIAGAVLVGVFLMLLIGAYRAWDAADLRAIAAIRERDEARDEQQQLLDRPSGPSVTGVRVEGAAHVENISGVVTNVEQGSSGVSIHLGSIKGRLCGGRLIVGEMVLAAHVPPAQRRVSGEAVRLVDLVDPDLIIRDRLFEGQDMLGPAVMTPVSGTIIEGDTLWAIPAEGNAESAIWERPPGGYVVGVIGIENCTFRSCRFINVGLAGPPDFLRAFRELTVGDEK